MNEQHSDISKVWLITGASRGLGRELAKVVLDAGHRVIATARKIEDLQALASAYGARAHPVELDVTDPSAAERAVATAKTVFGRLDVLVNNAGYATLGAIEDTSIDEIRAQIETNLFGVINVTKAAIPIFRQQRAGHIVQVSSLAARSGSPGRAAYAISKCGINGFSDVLAKELGPLGIKIIVVEPGGLRTDFPSASLNAHDIRPEYEQTVGKMAQFQHAYAGNQPGDPAKAARAILHVTGVEHPPLRLLLGRDAVQIADKVDAERRESDQRWRQLALSIDFDERPVC